MSVPYRSSAFDTYSVYDEDDVHQSEFELQPGDRIGGPVAHANDILAWCLSLVLIIASGWIMLHDDGALLARLPEMSTRLTDMLGKVMHATPSPGDVASVSNPYVAPSAAPAQTQALPPPLPETTAVSEAPANSDDAPAIEPALGNEGGAGTTGNAAAAPSANDAHSTLDAYQKRAQAVGLNPEISHALLMRFSAADFRNARTAINRAVAKTPDDGVFVWPHARKPGAAQFKVHFVNGAGPGCRRYVVGVTMNNWTTTALPMQKCAAQKLATRRSPVAAKKHATP